jgi:hypothetical protein
MSISHIAANLAQRLGSFLQKNVFWGFGQQFAATLAHNSWPIEKSTFTRLKGVG